MKYVYYYISLLVFLCSSCRAQDTSLLMVHFGTTYDDTRRNTIDAINEKARKAFPTMTVREAYTSHIVISRLAKRGIRKDTPTEALLKLRSEGVRTVKVQPSYVIDGIEMDRLRKEIEQVRPFFDSIWVSTPLLYSVEDAGKVCEIMASSVMGRMDPLQHSIANSTICCEPTDMPTTMWPLSRAILHKRQPWLRSKR